MKLTDKVVPFSAYGDLPSMKNLSWLIWMEASFQNWAKSCTIFAKLPKPTRLAFFNMLYGPHLGEH